jgi:hypothetical protein
MHFLDVPSDSPNSGNSEDLAGKEPEPNIWKNLRISRIWWEIEPKLSSMWQLKEVED